MIGACLAGALLTALPVPGEDLQRPSHQHGLHGDHPVAVGDVAFIVDGPTAGVQVRIMALTRKFFDAEMWAECLMIHPDSHGHRYWMLVPVCALERSAAPLDDVPVP